MYFYRKVQVRLREVEFRKIKQIIKKQPEIESVSHFVRISVIHELRDRQ